MAWTSILIAGSLLLMLLLGVLALFFAGQDSRSSNADDPRRNPDPPSKH